MSEIRRIRGQLRAAFDGSPWYGTSVAEILEGVTAEDAAEHPVSEAHSIWELVLHMAHWRRVALEALAGRSIAVYGADVRGDWRTPETTTEEAWQEARRELRQTQDELLAILEDTLEEAGDDLLAQTVPGREYPFYVLLHGVVQHDVYHLGQIALLKKARNDLPF